MKKNAKEIAELYMMECLALAEKGAGYVSPNPMVGAVVVKNGKIIGRGYHKIFGGPHAEVNAIKSAKCSVKDSTLYVNLEPCNFFGKTPPCTDLIIKSKISKVVVGMLDPNPLVSGNGIKVLKKAGIKVELGILNEECKKLNETYIKYITTGLPFVTIKVAQTIDGKIADVNKKSKWITNSMSQRFVHNLRSQYDAVLIGSNTVALDDPELTVRKVKGRNPIRFILDGKLSISKSAKLLNDNKAQTIILTSTKFSKLKSLKISQIAKKGIEIIELPAEKGHHISLKEIIRKIGELGITSILVEGGAETFSNFLSERLFDKLYVFIAPKILGNGLNSFSNLNSFAINNPLKLKNISTLDLNGDILIEGYL